MSNFSVKLLTLAALLYWASGLASFLHDKLEHGGHNVASEVQQGGAGHQPKDSNHDDHDDCPTCQTLKMMKAEPTAPPILPVASEPLVEIARGMQAQLATNPLVAAIDARGPPIFLPF